MFFLVRNDSTKWFLLTWQKREKYLGMICLFLKMTLLKKMVNQNEADLNLAEITLIEMHFVVLYCGTCLSNCHLALIIWTCRRMYMLLILLFNLRHSVWLINLNICMHIYIYSFSFYVAHCLLFLDVLVLQISFSVYVSYSSIQNMSFKVRINILFYIFVLLMVKTLLFP